MQLGPQPKCGLKCDSVPDPNTIRFRTQMWFRPGPKCVPNPNAIQPLTQMRFGPRPNWDSDPDKSCTQNHFRMCDMAHAAESYHSDESILPMITLSWVVFFFFLITTVLESSLEWRTSMIWVLTLVSQSAPSLFASLESILHKLGRSFLVFWLKWFCWYLFV